MVIITRSKLIIFLILLVTLVGITFLNTPFTFYAVIQSSSSYAYGEGYYGEGEYGYGTARPTVALRTPEDSSTYTKSSVSFIYNVSAVAVNNCSLIIDGAVNGSVDTSITVDTNQTFTRTLYNDTYTWSVNCTDDANRENASETWTVTVDCQEDWTCTSWSACSGGTQTRTCTDNNECFTEGIKPTESQNCSTDAGTGGAGGGGGGGGGKQYVPPDLEISQTLIKVELKQGETKSVELTVKNTGSSPQSVAIDPQGLETFILVSDPSFVLEAYEEKNITLVFAASRTELPEVYMGTIIVKSEYTQQKIMTLIDVLERNALFDIIVKVPEEFKRVEQGGEVEAEIMMYNLGDLMPVDVILSYAIKDFEGNVTGFGQDTFAVEEEKKIRRKINVPEDLKPDFYIFYALLEYKEQKATSSAIFEVTEKAEEKRFPTWQFVEDHKLAIIIFLIIILTIAVYGSYQIAKKVRRFIKSGKTEEPKKITRILVGEDKFIRDEEKKKVEKYIMQKLQDGYTEQMIIKSAKESGWKEDLVRKLLKEAKEGKIREGE